MYLSGKDDNPDAYELAARAYLAKKDYEKAEESLRKALKIAPERKSSKIVLAEIYIESGKTGKTETFIDEVIKSDDRCWHVKNSIDYYFFIIWLCHHDQGRERYKKS